MTHCYVGGYWYGRPESKESCVARAAAYFARLGAHDPALGEWLPRRGPSAARLGTLPSMMELIKITVEQWEPERAGGKP